MLSVNVGVGVDVSVGPSASVVVGGWTWEGVWASE